MNKRKEAQKLAGWALSKISQITNAKSSKNTKSKNNSEPDDVTALEAAFGNLDVKIN